MWQGRENVNTRLNTHIFSTAHTHHTTHTHVYLTCLAALTGCLRTLVPRGQSTGRLFACCCTKLAAIREPLLASLLSLLWAGTLFSWSSSMCMEDIIAAPADTTPPAGSGGSHGERTKKLLNTPHGKIEWTVWYWRSWARNS